MGFNLLGAIGGAVGGFFTGGPVGAAIGGVEGASSSAPTNPPAGLNPLLPQLPQTQDTMTALLSQGAQPFEDLSSTLDAGAMDDLAADSSNAMASIAGFS